MTYIIQARTGEHIKIDIEDGKPVSKVKITLIQDKDKEIAKTVSFRKEG